MSFTPFPLNNQSDTRLEIVNFRLKRQWARQKRNTGSTLTVKIRRGVIRMVVFYHKFLHFEGKFILGISIFPVLYFLPLVNRIKFVVKIYDFYCRSCDLRIVDKTKYNVLHTFREREKPNPSILSSCIILLVHFTPKHRGVRKLFNAQMPTI